MQVKMLGAKLMLVALLMLANIVISALLANLAFWIIRRYRVRERVRIGHEQECGQHRLRKWYTGEENRI